MRVAVLKGGSSLERTGLAALRRAGRGRAGAARPRGRRDRRRRRPRRRGCASAPDVAFVALHGRDGEDGTVQELLEVIGHALHGLAARRLHALHGQGARQARAARRRHPDAGLLRLQRDRFEELGAARGARRRSRSGSTSRSSSSRPAQGSALGIKFARGAAEVPGALVAAFSYDRKVLLERYVRGARPRGVGARGRREALPIVEAIRPRRTSTTSRRATRSAARGSSARPSSPRRDRARPGARARGLRAARLPGFARVDLMLDDGRRAVVLEANAIPGLTETRLLPLAADAAGIAFDELVGACRWRLARPSGVGPRRAPAYSLAGEVLRRDAGRGSP